MQNVSSAYKNSIRQIGRNRGYIRVTIGVVNSDAQDSAKNHPHNRLFYLADPNKIFNGYSVDKIYATCEEEFSSVDGTMYFAPQKPKGRNNGGFYNNGLISDDILGEITIDFGSENTFDIKGLTIDFSDSYPTSFIIKNGNNERRYENDSRIFMTEDAFLSTNALTIKPIEMKNGNDRLRIFGVQCGIANVFTNNELITFNSKEYVSPIADTIPSNDISFTVDNKDYYFCPDNPDSALSFFEIGQEVKVQFGYDTYDNGEIEWLPERKSFLKTWKANRTQATFTATDKFDNFNSTYYKGKYYPNGISLYDLAVDVFADAGISESNYYIDKYLQKVIVNNPLPPTDHASELQIIANAGRCTLSEDRKGRIHLQSSFIPKMQSSIFNATDYSKNENILSNKNVIHYAETSSDFSTVDGNMFFFPNNKEYLETSYISKSCADADGNYELNPKIEITLESEYAPFSFSILFGNNHPNVVNVKTYLEDREVSNFDMRITDNFFTYNNPLEEFDKMVIEVTNGHPNSRCFIDKVYLGGQSDYHLQKNTELKDYPLSTRLNKVKSITINKSVYSNSSEFKELIHEEITLADGETDYTVYFNEPSYNLSVVCETTGVTATIIESSNYMVKIRFSGNLKNNISFTIKGYEYVVENQKYIKEYNEKGEERTWSNPLVSTTEHAEMLESWLSSFFLGDLEYEVDWRGDPRVDANDMLYLETVMGEVPVRCYENILTFSNSGWGGNIKARKVVL